MGKDTKIEWADDSVNFWWGCTHHGSGCLNCYAESLAKRTGRDAWGPTKPRHIVDSAPDTLRLLNRAAKKKQQPRLVFINSMSDFFEDFSRPIVHWDGTPSTKTLGELRTEAFNLFDELEWLRFLLLTKRPKNISKMWPAPADFQDRVRSVMRSPMCPNRDQAESITSRSRQNVWLGTSISKQSEAEENLYELKKCRDLSPVLFVSAEPLIEEVDLEGTGLLYEECRRCIDQSPDPETNVIECRTCDSTQIGEEAGIDWVIVGGESGAGARACDVVWIRKIIDQCQRGKVSVFVKQLGAKPFQSDQPADSQKRFHLPGNWNDGCFFPKLKSPKGGDKNEWPEDLRVRQFPEM